MHYLTTNEPLDVIVLLCYSFNCMRVSIQLLAAIQINQLVDWLIDWLIYYIYCATKGTGQGWQSSIQTATFWPFHDDGENIITKCSYAIRETDVIDKIINMLVDLLVRSVFDVSGMQEHFERQCVSLVYYCFYLPQIEWRVKVRNLQYMILRRSVLSYSEGHRTNQFLTEKKSQVVQAAWPFVHLLLSIMRKITADFWWKFLFLW